MQGEVLGAWVELSEGRARFHGCRLDPIVAHAQFRHVRRGGESLGRCGLIAKGPVKRRVRGRLVVQNRCAFRFYRLRIGREHFVLDVDRRDTGIRALAALRHDQGNRFSAEADNFIGQKGTCNVPHGFARTIFHAPVTARAAESGCGNVPGGINRKDTWHRQRGTGINARDAGMRSGCTNELRMRLPGPLEIVGKAAQPSDQARILAACRAHIRVLVVSTPGEILTECVNDVLITRAAAQITAQGLPCRIATVHLRARARQDHAWRTETALQGVTATELLLQRRQAVAPRCALDRGDFKAGRLPGKHRARLHGSAVDQYCACAALRSFTAFVNALEAELIPQDADQRHIRIGGQ